MQISKSLRHFRQHHILSSAIAAATLSLAAFGAASSASAQSLGVIASDNANNYGGNWSGNGGFGFGSWSLSTTGGSNGGSFIGSSQYNGNSDGNIDVSGNAWGLWAHGGTTSQAIRSLSNAVIGSTFSIKLDSGYDNSASFGVDAAGGFQLRDASGNTLLEFRHASGRADYEYQDSTGYHDTGISWTSAGIGPIEVTQTGASTFRLTIGSSSFTGTFVGSPTSASVSGLRMFRYDPTNSGGADYFFNSTAQYLPVWNGASSGNWSTSGNWTGHSIVNGGSVVFNGGSGAITSTNDSSSGIASLYNITFNGTGTAYGSATTNATTYTLAGNALTLNGGIDNNSTNAQTINNNLTLGASQSFNATSGALNIGGNIALNGSYLTVNAANAVTLSGVISGNGDIVKSGADTLTLGGANTFTGTGVSGQTFGQVFVTNGTLRAASNAALGTQVSGVSVDLGAANPGQGGTTTNYSNNVTLLANSGVSLSNQIYVAPNTGGASRTIGSDGTTGAAVFSGNILLTGSAKLTAASGGDVTFSGVLGTSGFTTGGIEKIGSGKVTLGGSSANNFAGATTVTAGTLELAKQGALGGTSSITINNGGTLLFSNSATTDRINNSASITINSGGKLNTASLSEGPANGASGAGAAMGALTLSSGATIDFGSGSGSNLLFASLNYTPGSAITIAHWSGIANIDNGSSANDRLLFVSDPGLTATQLAAVQFTDDSGNNFTTGAREVSFNGYIELVAVPEPTTILGALALLGFVGARERRRVRAIWAQALLK